MRKFLFRPAFLLVFAALLGGCATSVPSAPTRISGNDPRYVVDVYPSRPPIISRDGFDAGLTFVVTAEDHLPQGYLVQELAQTMTYEYSDGHESNDSFTLVECFRLRYAGESMLGPRYELDRGQFDRHFYSGLMDLSAEVKAVRLERTIIAYVANVEGADFTSKGFAQLECNETGDVVSNSPRHFNESYRKNHETRGQPSRSNREGGVTYKLSYRLERIGLGKADFEITRAKGSGRVFQSSVVLRG